MTGVQTCALPISGRGATKSEAAQECAKRGLPKTSFYRAWDAALTKGLISVVVLNDRPTVRFVVTSVESRISQEIPTGDLQ